MNENESERRICAVMAPEIHSTICVLLDEMSVNAHVSYCAVEEVIIHYWRDLERLNAVHHEVIHPTKACSYLAFWVRKLKPVSDAFHERVVEAIDGKIAVPEIIGDKEILRHTHEITDINEQVSIHLAVRLLRNCVRDGRAVELDGWKPGEIANVFDKVANNYLTSDLEDGISMGLRFYNIIYDMRFRTYGPHHLTQILTHIVREVYSDCRKKK
jgi:hypothetical protein